MNYRNNLKYFIVGLVICFFVNLVTIAQPNGALFNNYSVANGLTDKTIHCVFQDSKGWIWIGSDFGVIRFDGYVYKKFNIDSKESHTLSNSLIRTIFEDKSGVLWFGTELNGVFKYDRRVYEIKQVDKAKLSNNSVWAITEDENNKLWFGTERGLNYYNPETDSIEKSISSKTNPGVLTHDFIRKLFLDSNQRLWIGTENGITIFNRDNTLFGKLLTESSLTNTLENQVWEIFQDKNENIWIGTYLGGLTKYVVRDSNMTHYSLNKFNERAATVRSIAQDRSGNIWVGTRGGLFSIEKNTNKISQYVENSFDEYSLIHNSVLSLLIDAKGDLWVGTRNGISYLNFERKAFEYINSFNSGISNLNNSEVYALWEDGNSNLWIGTENGGVNIFNTQSKAIKYITTENNLSNNCIKAISPDSKGNVLIGTYLGGLNKYNPRTGGNKVFTHDPDNPKSISDNSVWTIFTDSNGRIWVGTSAGLDLFNESDETFTHYGEKYGLGWVSFIYEDMHESLWLYSMDHKNLTMVTPGGTIKHYPFQSRAMAKADSGYLWISTMGDGLLRFNPKTKHIQQFTTEDGLCSDVIYGMVKRNDNTIWLSTNNGLSRFNLTNQVFKNYLVSNGLLNNQFNYGASIECSNDVLAFGGKEGVDLVNILELYENEYIPPVVLTDFRIFNKKVSIISDSVVSSPLNNFISETRQVELAHDQNMITFEFAALNYANADKNTYRYKLEGFDKDWNEIGNNHSATYTNLDFGEYTFRVIGTNSDNRFDPKGLTFQLNILPPFWKTWAFRLLMLGLIGLLLYVIYVFIVNREKLKQQLFFERKNARQIKEIDRLKHQFFMNISHEIRTPLTLITGPLDRLLKSEMDRASSLAHLGIIERNTTILSKLVNQLLDYRKLETGNLKLELKQGNLGVFLEELISNFTQFAEDKNIEIEKYFSDKSIFFAFDSDKLEKILRNLFSNALKFTNSGGKVVVSVAVRFIDELEDTSNFLPPIDLDQGINQFVRFTIRDTGIGIPSSQLHKIFDRFRQIENKNKLSSSGAGIGLSLTKELVKLHNGHINVKSVEGKGSKFTLLLPYVQYEDIQSLEAENEIPNAEIFDDAAGHAVMNDDAYNKKQPILLIVDDNPDIRIFVKHHFETEYKVLEAVDGREGWNKTLEAVPDLVIADVMMPEIDGVELCRKIKNDERTSHIPVLLLTALTAKEKQLDGISAGAEDYITKPFDVALLKAKTDNQLYIRKALRERYSKELLLKPKDIVLTSPDEKFLRKVIQVIEKNISQPELDVDYLAKNVGVSRTQLYRKISALTDMAAKEFVRDIRLKRAAQLIAQDKLHVSEVAIEVGFNDVSYFRKCFKEKFGMSASEYKKIN